MTHEVRINVEGFGKYKGFSDLVVTSCCKFTRRLPWPERSRLALASSALTGGIKERREKMRKKKYVPMKYAHSSTHEEYQHKNRCLECDFWDKETLIGFPGCTYPGRLEYNKHTGLCTSRSMEPATKARG